MKAFAVFCATLYLVSIGGALSAQNWLCDGKRYVSLNDISPPTRIYSIEENGPNFSLSLVHEYDDLAFNAMGYNPVDGLLYALNEDGSVVLLYADGTYDVIGRDPQLFVRGAVAGDIDALGRLIVQDRRANTINIYQVLGSFRKLLTIPMVWAESSPNSGRTDLTLTDVVVHQSIPNTLIAHQKNNEGPGATRGYMLFINIDENSPDLGKVYPIFRIPSSVMTGYGALFYDQNKNLFAYGTDNLNVGGHYKLYEIDLQNESIDHLSDGPRGNGVDGCSCPKAVDFNKRILWTEEACDSTKIVYLLQVINRSNVPKADLHIADSISNGGRIDLMAIGGSRDVTWTATEEDIQITIPSIDGLDTAEVIYHVNISNDALPFENQAYLRGVWAESDVPILSDDPTTAAFPDPTILREEDLDFTGLQHYVNESFGICEGDTIEIQGNYIHQPGEYNFPLGSGTYCDTVLIAKVEALESFSSVFDLSICKGDTLDFYGREVSTSGTYEEVFQASNSCDSIVVWNVNFTDTLRTSEDVFICRGDTLIYKGLTIYDAGLYYTWIPGANCDTLLEVNATVHPLSQAIILATPTCAGLENGRIELSPDQNAIKSWVWENGSTEQLRTGLDSGTYSLTYEDEYGCWSDTSIALSSISKPSVTFDIEGLDCHNDFIGKVQVKLADADGVSLNNGPFVSDSTFEIHKDGVQRVSIKKEHCEFKDSVLVPIIPPLEYVIENSSSGLCEEEVVIRVRSTDGGPLEVDTLRLNPLPHNTSIQGNIITFTLTQNVSSVITIVDSHGCQYEEPLEIALEEEGALFVPNVFTPNGDNINDVFTPFTSPCIEQIELLEVYDRWGELIFQKKSLQPGREGWDGQLNGQVMTPGVYTWRLILVANDDERFDRSGSVTLLR